MIIDIFGHTLVLGKKSKEKLEALMEDRERMFYDISKLLEILDEENLLEKHHLVDEKARIDKEYADEYGA